MTEPLQITPPPELLHKFRALGPQLDERTAHIILEDELWFSTPDKFNDPFDSKPAVHFPKTPVAVEVGLKRLAAKNGLTRAQARQFAGAARGPNLTSMRTGLRDGVWAGCNLAVCSLMPTLDSILSWSHYADSHRGLSLTYSTRRSVLLKQALPIIYSRQRPVLNSFGKQEREAALKAVLTKADCWQYENEWRVIATTDRSDYQPLGIGALESITFGALTPQRDIEFVRDLNSRRARPVTLYQMVLSEADYTFTQEVLT